MRCEPRTKRSPFRATGGPPSPAEIWSAEFSPLSVKSNRIESTSPGSKPGDAELKPDLGQSDLQFLKLDGQQLAVPSGLFCKSVVGQHASADFFLAEVRKSDDRKAFETEKLGGGKSPMTCDDPALIVDNQGIDHAEPQHRVGDLPNLLLGVGAGVPPRKAQPTETHHLNWSRIGGGFFARVRNLSTGFKLRSFGFSGAHS